MNADSPRPRRAAGWQGTNRQKSKELREPKLVEKEMEKRLAGGLHNGKNKQTNRTEQRGP